MSSDHDDIAIRQDTQPLSYGTVRLGKLGQKAAIGAEYIGPLFAILDDRAAKAVDIDCIDVIAKQARRGPLATDIEDRDDIVLGVLTIATGLHHARHDQHGTNRCGHAKRGTERRPAGKLSRHLRNGGQRWFAVRKAMFKNDMTPAMRLYDIPRAAAFADADDMTLGRREQPQHSATARALEFAHIRPFLVRAN